MLKIFELYVTRNPADEAALGALAEAAGAFAQSCPHVAGFTLQSANPVPARKDIVQLAVPAEVDAFAEFWVADEAAWHAALGTEAGKAWRAVRTVTIACANTLLVQEHALIPVPDPRPGCRNNAFLTRNPALSEEGFMNEWVGEHGAMCHAIPYLRGFVPCKVLTRLPELDVTPMECADIEGIAQAYFDSPEEELQMIGTPEAKEWFAHGAITFGLIKAFGARELSVAIPATLPAGECG